MAKEVFMPKAGMDMQEGTIIRWLAAEGDPVKEGQPLLEIETDKVTMEVESPCDGVLLRRYFEEGAVVPVVTIIGYVGRAGEEVPDRPSMAGGTVRARGAEMLSDDAGRQREKSYDFQTAVIGGGASGLKAALRSARMGRKTILFEKKDFGGTCTNSGSLPMKIYLHTARLLEEMKTLPERGAVLSPEITVDMARVRRYKDGLVSDRRMHDETLLRDAGVVIVREDAEMIGRHLIRAGQCTYRVEHTILCT